MRVFVCQAPANAKSKSGNKAKSASVPDASLAASAGSDVGKATQLPLTLLLHMLASPALAGDGPLVPVALATLADLLRDVSPLALLDMVKQPGSRELLDTLGTFLVSVSRTLQVHTPSGHAPPLPHFSRPFVLFLTGGVVGVRLRVRPRRPWPCRH